MMDDKKKQPPSAALRRNLYWPADMDNMVEKVAEILHRQGEKGLYNSKGEVNRTAVFRRLLENALDSSAK
jgi:hypothetical protein